MPGRSRLSWCGLLALGIVGAVLWTSVAGADEDEDIKAAKAAVNKLSGDIAAGKKITQAEVQAIVKKHDDLEAVMSVYKASRKGDPTLEQTLNKLAKKMNFTAADKATLTRIANLSRALALLTPHYTEKTKGNAGKKKEWDKYTKDMGDGAVDLLKAIKEGNAGAMRKTADKLAGSCTDCHGAFRSK